MFFSELKNPKLGDFISLNLKVRPDSFSKEEGRLAVSAACKSKVWFRDFRPLPLLKLKYFRELA
jgi:hypothetical protein